MKNTTLEGQLEIDHNRGVIYFHIYDEAESLKRGVATALRICRLPAPIPLIEKGVCLDISEGVGVSWGSYPQRVSQKDSATALNIGKGWTPTPDAIEALPLPLRDHIVRLEADLEAARETIAAMEGGDNA